jgi:hypothetical protein
VHDLYDGQRMRPEKLAAWQALRERYGNRDESRVDRGNLFAPGHLTYPADHELLPKLRPEMLHLRPATVLDDMALFCN